MVRQFVKYNPAFLENAQLVENFVVRQTDLQMIIKIIRENTEASNQHVLIIGPRGSGKTTLVRRVSAEIEQDKNLCRTWYPLVFAEESYNALSVADFWLEAIFHLAKQTGEARWKESYHELRRDPDEKRLAQRALGQLLDFADSIGKRILLVVENLDMLLSEFSSKKEAWSLRHTLMNEPRLMLLGTATARFEQIEHPGRAMFEMLRIHNLVPLSDEECNAIWALVAGEKLPGNQIRPIRILTGGNARLIALIARFGAKRSFRELLEDLVDLIDEHTDYFKSHLDNMASTERKAYLALAELWKPSTAKEIAEVARLNVNTTSALLKRLASRGKVQVDEEGKRKKWYSVSEGIYNIYYLMRRRGGPSAKVKAAVRFMVSLYEPVSAAKLIIDESCNLMPDQCRDHIMALEEIYQSAPVSERCVIARSIPSEVFESPYLGEHIKEDISAQITPGNVHNEEIKKVIEEIQTQLDLASKHYHLYQYQAAIDICLSLYDKYGDREETEVVARVAGAMFNKGVALGKIDRSEEAVEAYDELIERYGSREETETVARVADAMLNKGVALGEIDRSEEAVEAYDELIERYGSREEAEIVAQVADAMFNKGVALGKIDRSEEAVEAYDELIERYGSREEAEIVAQVAGAMSNKGVALGEIDRFEEAVEAYDELIERYGSREETEIVARIAGAMFNKGLVLGEIDRFEEAVEAYDELIERYGSREETEIVAQIARAIFSKGLVLGEIDRFEEAVEAYDELIERYGSREETEIVARIAGAMFNKGLVLGEIDRFEEAVEVYDEVIERYGSREETEIVAQIARAIFSKGLVLGEMGRSEEAIEACDELIEKYGSQQEISIVKIALLTRLLRARVLLKLKRKDDAFADVMLFIAHHMFFDELIEQMIDVFVDLAAYGHAEKALELLVGSQAEQHLEPLVAGLRMYCGHESRVANEILEVARDVVKRIEERKLELENKKQ